MAVQKPHLLTVLGDAKISVWLRKQEKVEGKGFSFASSISYLLQLTWARHLLEAGTQVHNKPLQKLVVSNNNITLLMNVQFG